MPPFRWIVCDQLAVPALHRLDIAAAASCLAQALTWRLNCLLRHAAFFRHAAFSRSVACVQHVGGQDETADPRKDEREDAGDLYGQNIRRQVTKIGSMVSVFGSSTVTPVAKLWLKSVGSASNAKYPQ